MKRWMRWGTLATATLALAVALAGPEAQAARRAAPQAPAAVSLVWYMRIDQHENAWEKERVQAFEKLHPTIQVQLITTPYGQFDAKFNTLLNSRPADIWSHLGQSGFADYYHRGLLYDYTPLIKKYGYDWGHTPKNIIDIYSKGGDVYAIPSASLGDYVFYNKDMFDAYNKAHPHDKLAYPPVNWNDKSWTWSKMVSYARKLANPAKHRFGIVSGLAPDAYPWLVGTDMYPPGSYKSSLPSHVTLTDPRIEKIFQQVADWANKDKIAPAYSDQRSAIITGLDLFMTGNVAMEPTGGWGFRNYIGMPFHWAVGALPYDVTDTDMTYTDPYMLYKGTQHPKEAFAFIKFLTSPPSMAAYLKEVGFIPANEDYLPLWYKITSKETGMSVQQLRTVILGARPRGRESPNHLIVNWNELNRRMVNDLDPLYFGSTTAKQQMPVVQSDVDTVLQVSYS